MKLPILTILSIYIALISVFTTPVYAQNFSEGLDRTFDGLDENIDKRARGFHDATDDASTRLEDFSNKSADISEDNAEALNKGVWQSLWDFLFKNALAVLLFGLLFWVFILWLIIFTLKKYMKRSKS